METFVWWELVDYNCGVVRANIVPPHNGLMEPGLYCSVCDAGPLDETDDE